MKIESIINFALRYRIAVLLVFAIIVLSGIFLATRLPIDAFPDTTPVQVQVNTSAPAFNPLEIEQQITLPLELAVSGLPGLADVRSISKFGLSQIIATFEDGTDIYNARQLIVERIAGVSMPQGVESPQLGPISTGLGEVFHYIVRSKSKARSLTEVRTIHDWIIKPQLRKVKGVAEVNSWGGYELQYQVVVSPEKLVSYNLTVGDLFKALEDNNTNVGGGQIVMGGQSILVHGLGRVSTVDEIGAITILAEHGTPVRIRDVATVQKGHEIRRGAVTAQGEGEAVLGLAFMLMGEDSKNVTEDLDKALNATRPYLPEDISVEVVYNRTDLVKEVIGTASHNLFAGAALVIAMLFIVMGNIRAGLIVAAAIPLAMLSAIIGMYWFGIAASLLSLGALDFGIFVDGSIVMSDVNMRRMAEKARELNRKLTPMERLQCIAESGREVVRPILFSMFIILIVFIPVLTLQNIEGKMFRPMALTFIFALTGVLFVSLLLSPVLSYYFLPNKGSDPDRGLIGKLGQAYARVLAKALQHPRTVVGCAGAVLLIALVVGMQLGGEFIPRLSEGSIVINTIRLAGVDIDESNAYNTRIEKILLENFPDEIEDVWSRIGTAEVATDAMGVELTDIFMRLKPRKKWKQANDQAELVSTIQKSLADLPGINMVYTQPIEMRLNEMISGIRSDVGIKIYGDNFEELLKAGDAIQNVLKTIKGAMDIAGEQVTGQPTLNVHVNFKEISRHGLNSADVLDFVSLIGNRWVGDIYEGQVRVPLTVRLPDAHRSDINHFGRTVVPTGTGPLMPLEHLASVHETEGPSTINREWGRRVLKIQCNVRGRDVASFVAEAQHKIRKEVPLPEGYLIDWGGQFENLQRSKLRLMILIPLVLLVVFILLWLNLRSVKDAAIIYSSIPCAIAGGIFALTLRGMPFSVSAAIGFIALFGIAVLDGQVMLAAIRRIRADGGSLLVAIKEGARSRLTAVIATDMTDAIGFIPMAISLGVGAEVQRPLATVVVGGILAEMVMSLLVVPSLYFLLHHKKQ